MPESIVVRLPMDVSTYRKDQQDRLGLGQESMDFCFLFFCFSGPLVATFSNAVEHEEILKLLSNLNSRGHRLTARWGEESLLQISVKQKPFDSMTEWERW